MTTQKTRVQPKHIIFLIAGIIFLGPLLYPLGLPIEISSYTQQFFNYIDALPAGTKVIYLGQYDLGATGNLIWFMDMWRHLARNHIKCVGLHLDPTVSAKEISELNLINLFNYPDYTYGEDWVYLGYIPGTEAALQSLHEDFQSIALADYKGTPASQLPILQGIINYKDFKLAIISCWEPFMFARQWPSTSETPSICMVDTYVWASAIPFYPQTFVAMLNGVSGAAEYEILNKIPGRAIAASDVITLVMLFSAGILVVTNVVQLQKRGQKIVKEVK